MAEATGGAACDVGAIPPESRARYAELVSAVRRSICEWTQREDGYEFLLTEALAVEDLREWVALEHLCCPFLDVEAQGAVLRIRGCKSVIEAEFLPRG